MPVSGTESRSSVTSSPDGIRRRTGSAETVPASTTMFSLCYYLEPVVSASNRSFTLRRLLSIMLVRNSTFSGASNPGI